MKYILWSFFLIMAAYSFGGCNDKNSNAISTPNNSDDTNADSTPPIAPPGLNAIGNGPDSIICFWSPSTDDVGVAGYRISRDGSPIDTITTTSFTDRGLASSTTYTYAVVAYDAAGNTSDQSFVSAATPEDIIRYSGECPGADYYPESVCANGSCIPAGLAGKVFAEWKAQYIRRLGLSETQFDDIIGITSVGLSDGSVNVTVEITYIIRVGWARSRRYASIFLGQHPLAQEPTDAEISGAVSNALIMTRPDYEKITITGVIPPSAARAALARCNEALSPDWCFIAPSNGTLVLGGFDIVDMRSNHCVGGEIDLSTGTVLSCFDSACAAVD